MGALVTKSRVLIIDDEDQVRNTIADILSSGENSYEVTQASNVKDALATVRAQNFDHILSDIYMEPESGLDFLKAAREMNLDSNIIMMSGQADTETAIEAIKNGASDYIHKPVTSGQLFFVLKRAEEQRRLKKENLRLRSVVEERYSFSNIIARSPEMHRIFDVIEKVKDYKTTVMITGESGTGKELVARALHFNSIRAHAPFVAVNCGGIPETLLESELFGHVKGAFTDAIRNKKGLFEEANGGTIFLDELGDLPASLQVKLLRVLQEEEIRPLGGNKTIKVDVRVIAATAKDLSRLVAKGKFREDLYYRINVLSIIIPPLRERREDIRLLAEHFIDKYNKKLRSNVDSIAPDAMEKLLDYKWPGNVRELENIIERAIVLTDSNVIEESDLPQHIRFGSKSVNGYGVNIAPLSDDGDGQLLSIKKSAKIMEKGLIKKALEKTGGNKTQAAHILEISLPALLYKIKDYGIT